MRVTLSQACGRCCGLRKASRLTAAHGGCAYLPHAARSAPTALGCIEGKVSPMDMESGVVIRPCRASEIVEVLELWRQSRDTVGRTDDPASLTALREHD